MKPETDKYLEFQSLRFSEKIHYHVKIESDELLDFKIPPRSLLTLIENTLIHGFKRHSKNNIITLHVFKKHKNLIITIEDNGMGVTNKKPHAIGNRPVKSNHHKGGYGLYCLKKTLYRYYGEDSDVTIRSLPDSRGAITTLSIPLNSKEFSK